MKLLMVCAAPCALVLWSIFSFFGSSSHTEPFVLRSSTTARLKGSNVALTEVDVSVQTATFYATGDAPYTRKQAVALGAQMLEVPEDAEFVIHIGDIRRAGSDIQCIGSQYSATADLLRASHAPVFVIIGDNDWTDCPNQEEGYQLWQKEFVGFESKYWEHSFDIKRQPGRPYNFAFEHKGSLFIGLNIIAGEVHDADEWISRLTDQLEWTLDLIRSYQQPNAKVIGRVVIFGHASPGKFQRPFFRPLREFIKNELKSGLPFFYLNGDTHGWVYQPNFYDDPSLLRITVSGMVVDPLLKITVTADGQYMDPVEAFAIDRRLELSSEISP